MMLYRLLAASDREKCTHAVLSLLDKGDLGEKIENLGVKLFNAELKKKGVPCPWNLLPVFGAVREFRPDMIQGWMYHGNLAATAAGIAVPGKTKVLWNIRHTPYDLKNEKRLMALLIHTGAKLSSGPARIIYNSEVSRKHHAEIGFNNTRSRILPNGFDCKEFSPDAAANSKLMKRLGIKTDAVLVGHVGRYHPMKDHKCFLETAGIVTEKHGNVHFVLAGSGIDAVNNELVELIGENGLNGRVHLLGRQENIYRIIAGFDIAVSSSSWGEGFPNVLGEAMACGVPCLATDIGDSAKVVGETGIVVPAGSKTLMAEGLIKLIVAGDKKRRELGLRSRERILNNYSLPRVVKQYEKLYEEVFAGKRS